MMVGLSEPRGRTFGFGAWGPWVSAASGLGFRVQGFRGLGFRGLGFRGLGFRVWGFKPPLLSEHATLLSIVFRGLGLRAPFQFQELPMCGSPSATGRETF